LMITGWKETLIHSKESVFINISKMKYNTL
jgi:hypothetical protein